MKKNRKGMTLIELLAVIAIIAILFILLIPQINSAIEKSRISGVQTDFHSYEVAARGYLMEVGDDEKTEEGLNRFLDKNLKSNSGEATEKGPWGYPYKIEVNNEDKQFVFTTLDKNKEPRTHKMIVSWGDENISSHYFVDLDDGVTIGDSLKYKELISELDNTLCESRTIQETPSSVFSVSYESEGAVITGYSGSFKELVIPCEINGKKVFKIGSGNGNGTFENKNLEVVIFPNTLKEIDSADTFYRNNLKKIVLPESIVKIGINAFRDNKNLKEVLIPNSLEEIGDASFGGNPNLEFFVKKDNTRFKTDNLNSGLYSFNGEKLIIGTERTFESKLFKNIKEIESLAFYDLSLKEILIPEKVVSISISAFFIDRNLNKVVNKSSIPNSTILTYFVNPPLITN